MSMVTRDEAKHERQRLTLVKWYDVLDRLIGQWPLKQDVAEALRRARDCDHEESCEGLRP